MPREGDGSEVGRTKSRGRGGTSAKRDTRGRASREAVEVKGGILVTSSGSTEEWRSWKQWKELEEGEGTLELALLTASCLFEGVRSQSECSAALLTAQQPSDVPSSSPSSLPSPSPPHQ
jgi:hypothetical protein